MPAQAAADKSVTTVEGIGAGGIASGAEGVHGARRACNAASARRASSSRPRRFTIAGARQGHGPPSREEIGAALSGHLCRCGAYDGIFRAVADACAGRFDGSDVLPPRIEARDKVTGSANYTVDIRHDGQLEGVILRSPFAHARIGELDLAPARAIAA